jgi:CheY-like chemotaxis protein
VAGCHLGKTTVLLVEDHPDVRDMMSLALQFAGHRVITAANGRDALELLHRERPCIILLDLMMPVMDGWQFYAALEQDPELRRVPLVVISALVDVSSRMPADAHLSKPVDIDQMLEVVDTMCRRAAALAEGAATERMKERPRP